MKDFTKHDYFLELTTMHFLNLVCLQKDLNEQDRQQAEEQRRELNHT